MSFPSDRYQQRIANALDEALKAAVVEDFDVQQDRLIIFSDHHKGARDGADDFRHSENAYHAALGYYFEKKHVLAILGDAEELWENDRAPVLTNYRETLRLEKAFHEAGRDGTDSGRRRRYWRVWGNHDDDWRFPPLVQRHLHPLLPGIAVHEGLVLRIRDGDQLVGSILCVHGHQGTLDSDRFGWLSRIFVRTIWRPIQRRLGINTNSPATDWNLRKKQNIALYNWAVRQQGLVLIAGHTHHPVFFEGDRIAQLESMLMAAGQQEQAPELRAELEYARVREAQRGFRMERPCYFNTGCCCYADGDITGLEIDSGEIRLVRWLDDQGRRQAQVLTQLKLYDVFSKVEEMGAALTLADDLQATPNPN